MTTVRSDLGLPLPTFTSVVCISSSDSQLSQLSFLLSKEQVTKSESLISGRIEEQKRNIGFSICHVLMKGQPLISSCGPTN